MKNIAIVGATGMVGQTMLQVIKERNLPFENLYLFASARSAGKQVEFNGKTLTIEELTPQSFDRGIDIALFSAGGATSKEYAPIAASKGCIAVDNSSAWRMDPAVPLVVPEVNPDDIWAHKGIIANPNCSTIQAVVALNPLHQAYGLKRVIYTTFQSVSGAGNKGVEDLERTIKGEAPGHFPYPIAGNCIPHIDAFGDDGYTFEEVKMIKETQKIMHAPDIKITATTVRVPVAVGHSESVNITFNNPFEMEDIFRILKAAPGIVMQDDVANKVYPTPRETAGTDPVYVGRIRRDFSADNSLNLWVVADNVRKGAATNAVQIAEELLKN
ncbi:MAG: aspartate-semialdehyde dehydrogenase [Defluviitaleaceae bacterium]|nr:aspartate-semialdehyde dehydrogenase [Defluviitaleaceae bacterium]